MTELHTSLNGKPSDIVPFEDGQLRDALYELTDKVGIHSVWAINRIESEIRSGDTSGTLLIGEIELQWMLK